MSEQDPLSGLERMGEAPVPLWRRLARLALLFFVTAALLWLCFRRVEPQAVLAASRGANLALLAAAVGGGQLALFLLHHWSLFEALGTIGLTGGFGRFLLAGSALQLPSSVQVHLGGAGMIAYLKRRHGLWVRHVMGAGGLLFFADGVALGLLLLPGRWALPPPYGGWASWAGLALLAHQLYYYGWIRRWWDPIAPGPLVRLADWIRGWEITRPYLDARPALYRQLVGLRLALLGVVALTHGAAMGAFGISVPALLLLTLVPLALFIGNLPVSLAGLGTMQAVMLVALGPFARQEAILAYSLAYSAGALAFRALQGALTFRWGVNELLAKGAKEVG